VGGDEFALLLSGCNHEVALARAERLCREINLRSMVMGGKRITLSVSAGVASFPEDGATSAHILRRADQALVWAKANGKNRAVHWRRFSPEGEARRAS
jgi:diguanylate cyclase (GGDEF)-like protein